MTKISIGVSTWARVAAATCAAALLMTATASAQPAANDPNTGAVTFTGGFDVPSKYVFRGLVQEADSKVTLFPYGDSGISVFSGEGGVKSATVNFGIWNSLMTGSSGTAGPREKLHYEEDFYASFGLGFAHGISLGTTYTAYTSPNGSFNTVHELGFKLSKAHWLSPYGLLAFELDGQADGGSNEGTYLELGVGPSWPIAGGKATISVPTKIGLSLKDYYEGPDGDSKFGYFQVGGLLTVPVTSPTNKFGGWAIKGGLDVYAFGDTPKLFNNGDSGKVVATFGIGVIY
ncbi:MAG TPA: hypothetical protein VH740_05060 [Vicinamibacterales bacterium]|jgi:hypothetical protein